MKCGLQLRLAMLFVQAAVATTTLGQVTFVDLGNCYPFAVSADGSVVAGVGPGLAAWRWSDGEFTDLGPFEINSERSVRGISDNGSVIVGRAVSVFTGQQPTRWTAQTGIQSLGWLPGSSIGEAFAVSGDGTTIVGVCSNTPIGAAGFRWTVSGGMEALDLMEATGVSADGSIVVGTRWASAPAPGFRAAQWTATTGSVELGTLEGATNLFASSVSGDGFVVVGTTDRESFPFRWACKWTQNGAQYLDMSSFPGPPGSEALGVSHDGSTIVGFVYLLPSGENAAVWENSGPVALVSARLAQGGIEQPQWHLTRTTAISGDGQTIVGYGALNGTNRGWLVRLAPVSPPCTADYNADGTLGVDDIFNFLTCWFAGNLTCANFNGDCCINVGDIFDYLTAWFAGCP